MGSFALKLLANAHLVLSSVEMELAEKIDEDGAGVDLLHRISISSPT